MGPIRQFGYDLAEFILADDQEKAELAEFILADDQEKAMKNLAFFVIFSAKNSNQVELILAVWKKFILAESILAVREKKEFWRELILADLG